MQGLFIYLHCRLKHGGDCSTQVILIPAYRQCFPIDAQLLAEDGTIVQAQTLSTGDCLRSFCSPQDSPDLVAESATVNRVEVLGLRDRDFAIFISILPGLLLFD